MSRKRRIVLKLDLEEPYRCNLDVFAGCQQHAVEEGWECVINPFADRALSSERPGGGFDGVLAHATEPLVRAAIRARVPMVNVSVDSPRGVPSVLPDCAAAGAMAAEHLLGRGFRQFGFLGFSRNAFSRRQREGFHAVLKREGFPCTDHGFGLNRYIANDIALNRGAKAFGLMEFIAAAYMEAGTQNRHRFPQCFAVRDCIVGKHEMHQMIEICIR